MHCVALILLVLGQQGEYANGKRGAQVVDMGGGKYDLVLYEGGLPGAGWKRGDRSERAAGLERSMTLSTTAVPTIRAISGCNSARPVSSTSAMTAQVDVR